MDILWDKEKNNWLILNRGVSFEEIAKKIIEDEDIIILENPTRENQQYFIINLKEYTWVVPFIISEHNEIILKTAFPSRKFHKKYGGSHEAN